MKSLFLILLCLLGVYGSYCGIKAKCFNFELIDRQGPGTFLDQSSIDSYVSPNNPGVFDPACGSNNCLTTLTFELTFTCYSEFQGYFVLLFGDDNADLVYPNENSTWTSPGTSNEYNIVDSWNQGYREYHYPAVLGEFGYEIYPVYLGTRNTFIVQIRNYKLDQYWNVYASYNVPTDLNEQLRFLDTGCQDSASTGSVPCNVNLNSPICQGGCHCFQVQLVNLFFPQKLTQTQLNTLVNTPTNDAPFDEANVTTLVFTFTLSCLGHDVGPIRITVENSTLNFVYPVSKWLPPESTVLTEYWDVYTDESSLTLDYSYEHNVVNVTNRNYTFVFQVEDYDEATQWYFSLEFGTGGTYGGLTKNYASFNALPCNIFNPSKSPTPTPTPSQTKSLFASSSSTPSLGVSVSSSSVPVSQTGSLSLFASPSVTPSVNPSLNPSNEGTSNPSSGISLNPNPSAGVSGSVGVTASVQAGGGVSGTLNSKKSNANKLIYSYLV